MKTGITAEQMIDSLLRIAPTARSTNIGIEDMVSTLAILVDQGQISERAATSLERALTVLSKVDVLEPRAQEAFKELGVDIEHVEDLMNQSKFLEVFRLLAEAGIDVSTASRIFGEDGQRAVLTLVEEIPRLEEFRGGLDDITGTMDVQAATMNKGLSGAYAAFLSSLSAAREALGDAGLRGWLERAADSARLMVEEFTALPPEVQRLGAYALAAGPVLIAMGGALQALSWTLAGFVPVLKAVGLLFSWWLLPLVAVGGAALLVVRNWDAVVAFFTDRFPRVVAFIEELPARARRAWAAVMDGSILEWVRGWDTGNVQQVVTEWYRRIAERFRELDWRDVGRYAAQGVHAALEVGLDALALASAWFDSIRARVEEADWSAIGESIGESIGNALRAVWRVHADLMQGAAEEDGELIGNRLLLGMVKAITAAGKLQNTIKRAIFDAFVGALGGLGGVLIDAASAELARYVILGRALADAIIAGITSRLGEVAGSLPEQIASVFLGPGISGALFAGGSDTTAALALGYSPASASGGAGRGSSPGPVNRSNSVNVEQVNVNVASGDPDVIAAGIADALTEQLHDTAENFDSDIAR